VALYSLYHSVQMLVHRPFMITCRNPEREDFSASLTVCIRAARSSLTKIDSLLQAGLEPLSYSLMSVFGAGVILLLSIWTSNHSGKAVGSNTDADMTDVMKCMQILKSCEYRWRGLGRGWDILYELAFVGRIALPAPSSNLEGIDVLSCLRGDAHRQATAIGSSTYVPSSPVAIDHLPGQVDHLSALDFEQHTESVNETYQRQEASWTFDSDMMTMWSSAPTGLESDDWGTFLNSFNDITQCYSGTVNNQEGQ